MTSPAPGPHDTTHDTYTSPLATRNASPAMLRLWSARHRIGLWRRVWLAIARAQHESGLGVSESQVGELAGALDVTDHDLDRAAAHERELRHDVMAHVHAWGERCPAARPVIHLGCTSQDVGCNADLLILDGAMTLIERKTRRAMRALAGLAREHRDLPTLGFTHLQPAQPTTVGRRAAGWATDLALARDLTPHPRTAAGLPRLRGFRGATGTQASFLALFDGDAWRVARFEATALGHLYREAGLADGGLGARLRESIDADPRAFVRAHTLGLTGQTYPRVVDVAILSRLGAIAAALHKIATDIRLLSSRKEVDEPFGDRQIGSSAMPYKRNPMRCERICGLTRFVMSLVTSAEDTAATQWLERTLDDSSNRRLILPEAFLSLDGALDLMHNVASGLVVHGATVRRNLEAELPFMATENLMMAAVRLGRDRQDVHEAIRRHAQEAGHRVKHEGLDNDLVDRLRAEPLLEGVDLGAALDPAAYVGLAREQVDEMLAAWDLGSDDEDRDLGDTEPAV